MSKRVFIACLNKQKKIWNYSYGSLIGGVVAAILVGSPLGMLPGLCAGAIGFAIGSWIDKCRYLGKLQRGLYWIMPYSKDWLGKDIPESSEKNEL